MKKFISFVLVVALATTAYFYRETIFNFFNKEEKVTRATQKKIPRSKTFSGKFIQPEELIDLSDTDFEIYLSKSGQSSSKLSTVVLPQVTGKITDIRVKVGDEVSKGETLITLGDSLPTDITDTQYQAALNSLGLLDVTRQLTEISGQNTVNGASLGAETAREAYQNALRARDNAEDLQDTQRESTEVGLEAAERAEDNARDTLNEAEDKLDELQAQYDLLVQNPQTPAATLQELATGIATLEGQIDQLENAVEGAETGVTQARLGLDQLDEGFDSQNDQMDFAIEAARLQYEQALNSINSAETGSQLQQVGVESQNVQAQSGARISALQVDAKNIRSAISGVVTAIYADEGNLVSPAQMVAKVENFDKLSITTSLNPKEAQLISVGDTVILETDSGETEGEVVSISPVLNDMTKKIDVEIEADNSDDLTAGELVKIKFNIDTDRRTFVPLNSLFVGDNNKYVKTVDKNNNVHYTEVQTGNLLGDYIEITDGLDGDEKVLYPLTSFIEEGDKVRVNPNADEQ